MEAEGQEKIQMEVEHISLQTTNMNNKMFKCLRNLSNISTRKVRLLTLDTVKTVSADQKQIKYYKTLEKRRKNWISFIHVSPVLHSPHT